MRIVCIVLVKNEDRFIETVLRNIVDFCDEIIVAINYPTRDNTANIVNKLMAEERNKRYK